MSYYRYTRLQQYINGQPTDTYTKGERVDNVDYSTYGTCMGGSGNSRWVSIPQTVCYNGDLWSMEKEQISYDGGISWVDTGNTRRASVIEQSSSQCFMSEWRVVPGEYICMMYAKWPKEAEYISSDGGQTWTATGTIRRGETVIELLSPDCGVIYQWIPTGEYICQGYNKYMKEKQVYSTDNGSTWTDTGNRRTGGLVEADSPYCGYEEYIYQWVDVSGEYVCQGYDKYTKQKEQRSSDNGQTWVDTGNTRAGSLIETSSTDCGYAPAIKATLTYQNGDTYNIPENGSSILTDSEVRRNISDTSDVHHYTKITGAVVYDTVDALAGSFEQCTNLASITLPSTAMELYGNTFIYCESLGSITLSNNTTLDDGGSNIFGHCTSLTNIIIPSSIKKLPYGFLSFCENLKTVTIEATDFNIFSDNVFFNCTSLESITLKATIPPTFGYNMLYNVPANVNIYVPCASLNAYKAASGWSTYANRIQCEPDYSNMPLTFETLENGSLMFMRTAGTGYQDKYPLRNIKYKKNDGAWTDYTYNTSVSFVAGDKISWKGEWTGDSRFFWDYSHHFTSSARHKVYGNPLSLTNAASINDGEWSQAVLSHEQEFFLLFGMDTGLIDASKLWLNNATLTSECYCFMFHYCTSLTAVPTLPATTLASNCYDNMFAFCSSLTTAPVLPATTLANQCYAFMFNNCTALTTAPALPAATLADYCYDGMFKDCTSLTTAPALPATTLAESCYDIMFENCTSLTTAPVLPATTLTRRSYYMMFDGCTNLNSVTCLATDRSATECTNYWLSGVSSTGTFTKAAGVIWPSSNSGIPTGWTVVEAS